MLILLWRTKNLYKVVARQRGNTDLRNVSYVIKVSFLRLVKLLSVSLWSYLDNVDKLGRTENLGQTWSRFWIWIFVKILRLVWPQSIHFDESTKPICPQRLWQCLYFREPGSAQSSNVINSGKIYQPWKVQAKIPRSEKILVSFVKKANDRLSGPLVILLYQAITLWSSSDIIM